MIRPTQKIQREPLPTMFEKMPPTAEEAEVNVIGAIFLNPNVLSDVCEQVSAADFQKPKYAQLFQLLIDLHQTNQPIEPNAVLTVMKSNRQIQTEDVEQLSNIIMFCVESTTTWVSAPYYARKVRECATRIRAMNTLWDALHALYVTDAPTQEVSDSAAAELMALEGEASVEIVSVKDLIEPAYKEIQERADAGVDVPMGFTTGLPDIDNMLGGLEDGTLTIVAARTSVGKTAFAQQVLEHIASGQAPGGGVSLEMSKKQLAYRLIASKAPVPNNLLRRPTRLDSDHWQKIHFAVAALEEINLFTAIAPGCTLERLVGIARRMHARGVRCLMIDHLGLMRVSGKRSGSTRNEDLGEITAGIKAIALDLKIPIVLLCQLNRIAATEKPALHHLRESGHIEEDADNVILLHRPNKDGNTEGGGLVAPDQEKAIAIIAKNRQGPCGEVDLTFFPSLVKFGCVSAPFGRVD